VATDYNATIYWGDGWVSSGTVSPSGLGFSVTGSHTYAQAGPEWVTVTIRDDGGSSTSVSYSVTVSPGTLSATWAQPSFTEGLTGTQVLATFTDSDGNVSPGVYSATIVWGDGGASTGVVSANPGEPGFQVTGAHAYAEEGSYSASVSITELDGASATVSGTVSVSDAPLLGSGSSFTATAGAEFAATVATFVDTGGAESPGDYQASIDWGDSSGSATGEVVLGSDGQTFSVEGTHTYARGGSFTVAVTVQHDQASPLSLTAAASVADPLSLTVGPVSTTEGQPVSGVVATFTDAAGDLEDGTYTALIDWGDSTQEQDGVVSVSGGEGTVSGDHT
jgi:hypothetical protein